MFMDITENYDLFMEEEPLGLPTSRDMGNFYGADFVQPGLLPLQPMLEELSVDVVQAVLQTPASAASTSLPIGRRTAASSHSGGCQQRQASLTAAGGTKGSGASSTYLTSLLSQPISSFEALCRGDMQVRPVQSCDVFGLKVVRQLA